MALLALQVRVAQEFAGAREPYRVLPPPPDDVQLALESFGDPEFLFRARVLHLLHAGSTDGRMVPYRTYRYDWLERWLDQLDKLNARSDAVPAMAAFLFVNVQRADRTVHLVNYLERHARGDPARKWRWMTQAVYITRFRLIDKARALVQADWLAGLKEAVPWWARQLRIFILVDRGDREAARALLDAMAADPLLPEAERRWIRYYLARHKL